MYSLESTSKKVLSRVGVLYFSDKTESQISIKKYNKEQLKMYFLNSYPYKYRYLDVKEELDDFTEGSRQLEAELEASLEQKEKTIRDLKLASHQLQIENESIYVSFFFLCDIILFLYCTQKKAAYKLTYIIICLYIFLYTCTKCRKG